MPVSIKMAKTQNLSLNPTKISGTCGRLMCCLKYEQDAYEDAVKRMPKNDSFVMTPDGPGNVVAIDLLRETVKVSLDGATGAPKLYHNCELNVLRNGKGSRDGIEIPSVRPQRYVKEEEIPAVENFLRDAEAKLPAAELPEEAKEEKSGSSRRRRGRGRGGRGGAEAPAKEVRAEKAPAENRGKGEKTAKAAEPQNDKPARAQSEKAPKPQAEKPAKGQKAPAPADGAGEEKKARRRRPHHRGGRRRHGGGEGAKGGAAE